MVEGGWSAFTKGSICANGGGLPSNGVAGLERVILEGTLLAWLAGGLGGRELAGKDMIARHRIRCKVCYQHRINGTLLEQRCTIDRVGSSD